MEGVPQDKAEKLLGPMGELMTTLRDLKLSKVTYLELLPDRKNVWTEDAYNDAIVNIFERDDKGVWLSDRCTQFGDAQRLAVRQRLPLRKSTQTADDVVAGQLGNPPSSSRTRRTRSRSAFPVGFDPLINSIARASVMSPRNRATSRPSAAGFPSAKALARQAVTRSQNIKQFSEKSTFAPSTASRATSVPGTGNGSTAFGRLAKQMKPATGPLRLIVQVLACTNRRVIETRTRQHEKAGLRNVKRIWPGRALRAPA